MQLHFQRAASIWPTKQNNYGGYALRRLINMYQHRGQRIQRCMFIEHHGHMNCLFSQFLTLHYSINHVTICNRKLVKSTEKKKNRRVKKRELRLRKLKKYFFLRAGFEPATYGFLWETTNYSPPLYQLSYRRNYKNDVF